MQHLHVQRSGYAVTEESGDRPGGSAMRAFLFPGKLCLFVSLCVVVGCGGGGGGGGPIAPTALANINAQLAGTMGAGNANVQVLVLSNGNLVFNASTPPAVAPTVTAITINRGLLVGAPTLLVDLLSSGAMPDANGTFAGTANVSSAEAQDLAANSNQFFVGISTSGADGFENAQIAPFTPIEWHAVLSGDEETTVVDPDAKGAASFRITAPDTLEFVLAMVQPAITTINAAHIHAAPPGIDGLILVDLNVPGATVDAGAGTMHGIVSISQEHLARISANLQDHYCNAHTLAAPGGIVRGQLEAGTVEMWSPLSGDEESTVIDATARGGVTLEFSSFTAGRATLAVPSNTQDINDINGAHVHVGGAGVDGIILIGLQNGADYGTGASTGSAEGAISYTQAEFTRILACPEAFYANLHTTAAPNGLVRGQLTRDPVTFFAGLSGGEETVVVDPAATGSCTAVVDGIFTCTFVINMVQPPVGSLTAADIHDGMAGADGPILIDLLNNPGVQTSGSTVFGRAEFSGRTFARLLAAPENFYCSAKTGGPPAGVARGQLVRVTEETPPAVSYDTPVVYQTGTAISENVPVSAGGGAVDSYSIAPALPAGLSIDLATGIISGTPTQTIGATDFTVTASNAAGDFMTTVNITVNVGPPTNLTYTTPVTYVTNTAITPNTPSNSGGAIASYSVNPPLPAGLNLNTGTGVISGTPTAVASAMNYTVTGTNTAGMTQATVNITVTAALQAPSSLSYTTPVTSTTGTAITPNSPTVTGTVTTWSITPALSAGLSFSTTTGTISGTPTATKAQTTYTVTAGNAAGSTQASVVITVNLGAPNNLSYCPSSGIGYVSGGTFPNMTPSSGGGKVSTYSISPALPAGISINSTTGVISGTPTQQTSQQTHTVTAANATGNTTAQVTTIVYQ